MKSLKYVLLILLSLFAFYGCEKDSGENPLFGDSDKPNIYVTWSQYMAYKLGETISIQPAVSPSDGATYKWTLGGKVISTEKDLSFKPNDYMAEELKFEVTRNGVINTRTANLLVPKPFSPKSSSNKKVAFLSGNGSIGDIDWESITHVVVSSVVVNAKLDADKKETLEWFLDDSPIKDLGMNTILDYAHHYGVYVMLEVSGRLNSYLNASNIYDSRSFYNAAIGAKQADLIKQIVDKAEALGVDGVNIYMSKSVNPAFDDPAALKTFYENFAAAVPEKKIIDGKDYNYLLSMSLWAGWTRGALAGVVNIPRYDWVNILAFGLEDLTPNPHSGIWGSENEVNLWLGWQGPIAPSRVVMVAPAFGLRYFGIPKDYTWGNLEQYTKYISYRDICAANPNAPQTNVIVVKDNGVDTAKEVDKTFYDGLSEIQQKAEFVKEKKLAGMAIWSVESDSKDPAKSLVRKMNSALGN